ncbi:MAG: TIGR02171 family protein [Fibrobacteraceae bacterium]|nr:TIGR02171 family protein [Fibrobacteraceae bacterium]
MPLFFLLCSCLIIFTSCVDNDAHNATLDYFHAGNFLVKVKASGKSVYLGTNDSTANSSLRPAMKVTFDYDYSIGNAEVTQDDWISLMDSLGYIDTLSSGDVPKVNVSYYDAILYLNALSKRNGYDTSYTYSKAIFNQSGYCMFLEGLEFDPSKEAFRLPTEAEWVYAASQGWNPKNSWNSSNANYIYHSICTKGINDLGICDMAGNVIEWVNDWLVSPVDSTILDYVGGAYPNKLSERILKGGSFVNKPEGMKLYLRRDVYTVTGASRGGYIGFRIAFGKIPSPHWLSSNGASATSLFAINVGASSIVSSVGTYRAKLVFRDDDSQNLVYVDFSDTIPRTRTISDTIDSYHPDISPDGSKVAFCTKPEGIEGTSELFVRNLDSLGSGLVKLNVASAAIPRWTTSGTDTSIIYVDQTVDNTDSIIWKTGATWKVPFSNGNFGTPVKLFNGTYNGGVSADGNLAVDGARLLRANQEGLENVWYGGEQACNASLEKNGAKRTLFLDFGGSIGKAFVGSSYSAHERLIIADSTGAVIQSIKAPSGYTFDHSEWTSISNFAIASLSDGEGVHSKIVLINTSDSSILNLVSGNELWHPSFWALGKNQLSQAKSSDGSLLNMDSLGVYYDESEGSVGYSMRYKMELFWKYRNTFDLAILGSSRPMDGIDPYYFKPHMAMNLAQTPNDIFISRYLFKNYLVPLAPKLKTILLSLDIDFWNKVEGNDWSSYYGFLPGFVYDAEHDYWKSGVPDSMYEYTAYSEGDDVSLRNSYAGIRGYFMMPQDSWGGSNPEVLADSNWFAEDSSLWYASFNCLKDMIALATENNIRVIGVIFPQSPYYKETGAFGKYGLTRSVAPRLIKQIKQLESKYSNFTLVDENKMGNHDYSDGMASDYDHLCLSGASHLSARLLNVLDSLENVSK